MGRLAHLLNPVGRYILALGEAMAVNSKQSIFASLEDQVLGTIFLSHPSRSIGSRWRKTDPTAAYQLVHDRLLLYGNSWQNLATFRQTWATRPFSYMTTGFSPATFRWGWPCYPQSQIAGAIEARCAQEHEHP